MNNVLIAGGSGYIGQHLSSLLIKKGYRVSWLSRNPQKNHTIKQYKWNPEQKEIETGAYSGVDVLINLSGAPINGQRWTNSYKQEIQTSRIQPTEFLYHSLSSVPNRVSTYLHASAVGFYGYKKNSKVNIEEDEAGKDFLAVTCSLWEEKVNLFKNLNIRTAIIRTGVVFNPGSEAYEKMIVPIRYYFGAALGSGEQYFPWIHIDDLCSIYLHLISQKNSGGIYNAVAPEFITNKEVTNIIARAHSKKILLPNLPAFVLNILLGEIAESILGGNKISSQKLKDSGFVFKHLSLANLFHESKL